MNERMNEWELNRRFFFSKMTSGPEQTKETPMLKDVGRRVSRGLNPRSFG